MTTYKINAPLEMIIDEIDDGLYHILDYNGRPCVALLKRLDGFQRIIVYFRQHAYSDIPGWDKVESVKSQIQVISKVEQVEFT